MRVTSWFKTYLLPGFVFQGVLIGGGYATGRELVEFFLSDGITNGVIGLMVATGIFSLVLAISFELARKTGSYDYRSFMQNLLGRAWILFEIPYLAILVLVLSVVASAAGLIVSERLAVPSFYGTGMLMLLIAALLFFSNAFIGRVFAAWSSLLYLAYALLFVLSFHILSGHFPSLFTGDTVLSDGLTAGARYAGYNLAVIPAVLFALRHISKRRQALTAGLLAGPLAMLPGFLFFILLSAQYPGVLTQAVPLTSLLGALDMKWFEISMEIVIFGTFLETGAGLVHAFNERVASTVQDHGKTMPGWGRSMIAIGLLLLSVVVASQFNLIDLIAQGYGMITYAILAVFVLPVLTIGLYRTFK